MDDVERLLAAVAKERAFEKAARKGREFADREFWSAYIASVMDRRAAADAWLKTRPPEPQEEAESIGMF